MSSDATKQARGFSYQRQYAIYYYLISIDTDIVKIIEEGKIGGLAYEDITLINNNNKLITYQIKFHTSKMRFCRSNSDLFKTLKKEQNTYDDVLHMYFVVSKNKNTFDKTLSEWLNKSLSNEEIYDKIINLYEDDGAKSVGDYNDCKNMLESQDKIMMLEYIDKITIQEGLPYFELSDEINKVIKRLFHIDDKIIIFYIKYKIFELFEKNWFSEKNTPLIIKDSYDILKNEFNTKTIDLLLLNKDSLYNKGFDITIDNIKKFIKLEGTEDILVQDLLSNLISDIKEFVRNYRDILTPCQQIAFLIVLSSLYEKHNDIEISNIYNDLRKVFAKFLFRSIKKIEICDDKIEKMMASLFYYYNHKIKNKLKIDKSFFRNIFSDEDIKKIKDITN